VKEQNYQVTLLNALSNPYAFVSFGNQPILANTKLDKMDDIV